MARDHRSEAGDAEAREPRRVESRGPGPFTTHQLYPLDGGGHQVANSRRHRKRLAPHRVLDVSLVDRPVPVRPSAFRHFWAPGRLAWWIAIVFAVGSGLFTLGGVAAAWPQWVSVSLREASVLNGIFIVGALFFTCGGALQWVEAINGDVAEAFGEGERRPWRWLGWRPRNLGYLASTVQLVGTLMFNVNTIAASFEGLTWQQQDLVVWTPNMVGCVCFLAASLLAYAEVAQGSLRVEVRHTDAGPRIDWRGDGPEGGADAFGPPAWLDPIDGALRALQERYPNIDEPLLRAAELALSATDIAELHSAFTAGWHNQQQPPLTRAERATTRLHPNSPRHTWVFARRASNVVAAASPAMYHCGPAMPAASPTQPALIVGIHPV